MSVDFETWWGGGLSPEEPMAEDQRWQIADLLDEVVLTDRELDGIKLMLHNTPTAKQAFELIGYLYSRLPDPVTERGRYSVGDLTKHINRIK